MQPLGKFLQHNFHWLFLFCVAWLVVGIVWRYFRHKRTGLVFPQNLQEPIRFEERAASGSSDKTWLTRIGGARHCLRVTVTDAEVWIRPFFPFNILAQEFDLEHRIARASITSIQPTQSAFVRAILVEYRDERGQPHRLTLVLKKPDDFLSALGLQTQPI